MAGTAINVSVKGERVIAKALNGLLKQGSNLKPALADIGEYLLASTQQHFIDQQAPNGTPWTELSSSTVERKVKRGKRTDRILTEEGTLADTLHYQLTQDSLSLGSNEEYAAMQQFGGITSASSMMPGNKIPARPFLGLALFERDEVLDIVAAHFTKVI